MKFEKVAFTTEQLVAGLEARHMVVGDSLWASRLFDSINYYRMVTGTSFELHQIQENIHFGQVRL